MPPRLPFDPVRRGSTPVWGALMILAMFIPAPGSAAEGQPPYPFEGTWVRADRVCSAAAPRTRTYTARDVTSAGGGRRRSRPGRP